MTIKKTAKYYDIPDERKCILLLSSNAEPLVGKKYRTCVEVNKHDYVAFWKVSVEPFCRGLCDLTEYRSLNTIPPRIARFFNFWPPKQFSFKRFTCTKYGLTIEPGVQLLFPLIIPSKYNIIDF